MHPVMQILVSTVFVSAVIRALLATVVVSDIMQVLGVTIYTDVDLVDVRIWGLDRELCAHLNRLSEWVLYGLVSRLYFALEPQSRPSFPFISRN